MPVTAQSPNYWPGRRHGPPIAVVIHTMAGTLASYTSWFLNPQSQVSAHYGVGLDGDFVRYVKRSDTAWANGLLEPGNVWPAVDVNPNWLTVAIETEDDGDESQEVTMEQFVTVRSLVRTVHQSYPSVWYVMGHSAISPRSRPNCPGSRWFDSGRMHQLADETGLLLLTA